MHGTSRHEKRALRAQRRLGLVAGAPAALLAEAALGGAECAEALPQTAAGACDLARGARADGSLSVLCRALLAFQRRPLQRGRENSARVAPKILYFNERERARE